MEEDYLNKPEGYYSLERNNLFPYIPKNLERVLDVGCSEGYFGRKLKEVNGVKEVWGIEPFDSAIPKATENLDKVLHEKIEIAIPQLPDNYFDCIFFNDVLEHLVDPYSILEQIRSKCKPEGWVFASIPNILNFETLYLFLKNKDWQYKDFGIMDRTHLRFFTKKSIHRMFTEAGYEVDSITGINEFCGKKFKILNFFLFNMLDEMKYIQMVVKARPLKK
jgi:2-polyprenyl-3-methyl-5-hydroxy-6-metoxy-1,4-benzoquinol methylase